MKYEYTYRNTPEDYWKFYLGNTYHSTMGIVNIAFTGAMFALIVSKWNSTNTLGKVLLTLGFLIFPLFQPLIVYFKSIRDATAIKADTTLTFDDSGLKIQVNQHVQKIAWRDFYSVLKRKTMVIAVPDGMHAYLIPNRILGNDKESFYAYVSEMIEMYSTKKPATDKESKKKE